MKRVIRLPLYGDIDHPSGEMDLIWDIFQSSAHARLRDISLSSTPSRFAAHGMAASRFEHSVGVAYLARKLCDWRPGIREQRDLLMTAALCHDIGSPPFSHISEIFMFDLTGRTHEEETEILLHDGTELNEIIASYRVDPAKVVEIINGEGDLGPLIAGSIDLDNIDNSIHLLFSIGFEANRYSPLELVKAYRWHKDQIHLDTSYLSQIVGWAETRRDLYDILHAEEHLSSATMLYRAIEFAYADGLIEEDFFRLGESDALYFLANRCGPETGGLINRTLRWKQFHIIHESISKEHDPKLTAIYSDWEARKGLADEIADRLDMKPEDLAVYIGSDRGEKAINLPFYGAHSEAVSELFRNRQGKQRLTVFSTKDRLRLKGTKKVEDAVTRAIAALPEAEQRSEHSFF